MTTNLRSAMNITLGTLVASLASCSALNELGISVGDPVTSARPGVFGMRHFIYIGGDKPNTVSLLTFYNERADVVEQRLAIYDVETEKLRRLSVKKDPKSEDPSRTSLQWSPNHDKLLHHGKYVLIFGVLDSEGKEEITRYPFIAVDREKLAAERSELYEKKADN